MKDLSFRSWHTPGLYTELHYEQLIFNATNQDVYTGHIRLHLTLFSEYHRAAVDQVIEE